MGKKISLAEQVSLLNKTLEKITIREKSGRWYARGSIYEKGAEPARREIAFGMRAREQNLIALKVKATELDRQLILQTFSWNDWKRPSQLMKDGRTIGEWVEAFKTHERPPNKKTWDSDKGYYFKQLPQEKLLSEDLLCKFVDKRWEPNSQARLRAGFVYGQLLRFAGLEYSKLRELCRGYTRKKVKPRDLPSDELIEENYLQIANPRWADVYALMAIYGLRPHEVFEVEPSNEKFGSIKILSSKTGERIAYPVIPDCWKYLKPPELPIKLPKFTKQPTNNKERGQKISRWFTGNKIPFTAYALRHAYAVRCLVQGLPTKFNAASMGHSEKVHTESYLAWINQADLDKIFENHLR